MLAVVYHIVMDCFDFFSRYMLSEVLDFPESEDFFDADVFMQPPNNRKLLDEGTDTADFKFIFGSYVADSILTQEEKLYNFDKEECGSKDEPSNSMNLSNEK